MDNRWTEDDWQSIVIVCGQDADGTRPPAVRDDAYGSGFIVQADAEATWIVTCAHVVERLTVRDRRLRVGDRDATLVSAPSPDIDLAVLRVAPRLPGSPLPLTPYPPCQCWVPGWDFLPDPKEWDARNLAATLGVPVLRSRRPGTFQRARALQITGFVDATPGAFDPREPRLAQGFSGAPVICPTRRAVCGVAMQLDDGGNAGYALFIEHLKAIWPTDAPPLRWREPDNTVIDADAWALLGGLFDALPAPLTAASLKDHCRRCVPAGIRFAPPHGDDPRAFLCWLIEQGPVGNRLPLHDALTHLADALADDLLRDRLQRLCAAIAAHHAAAGIDLSPPPADADPARCIGLRIELIPAGDARGTACDVVIRSLHAEAEPRLAEPREGPAERLRPHDSEAVGWLVDDLLQCHVPADADPATFLLTFRLPRPLLGLPVDRWCGSNGGDALGIDFPVVVEDADRHAGNVAGVHWQRAWQGIERRLAEPCTAALGWCDGAPAETDPLRDCARKTVKSGQAVALTQPLDPRRGADAMLLRQLLGDRGVPVLLWSSGAVAGPPFRNPIDAHLAEQPLGTLPLALRDLRRARADDRARTDAEAHCTLLWDPPPEQIPRRPSLFGVSD